MNQQLELLDGMTLRNFGIQTAITNAEKHHEGWFDEAVSLVKQYASIYSFHSFMCEDVRVWAEQHKLIERPPHARAWGAVMIRAAKEGFIKKVGFGFTKNPLAHQTPATLWNVAD